MKLRTYKQVNNEKGYIDEALSEASDKAILYLVEEEATSGIQINKDRITSLFLETLYSSIDIDNPSEKERLDFHIPLILVTSMDGFYVYFIDEYEGSDGQTLYKKKWSEKFPFYYEDEDFIYRFSLSDIITLYDKKNLLGPANGQRIFTLNAKDLVNLDKFEGFRKLRPESFLLTSTDFYQVRKSIITDSIENALNNYCNRHNEVAKKLGISYHFHLPTISGELSKAIDSPALIVLMQGYPLTSNENIVFNRLAISSSQLVKKKLYILEEKDQSLIYHRSDCKELLEQETNKQKSFYNVWQAAKEGGLPCNVCIN